MILAVLLLLSGLSISVVAIYYSVMGLMAIFSAAAVPIAIMGIALEIGKLVTASWIKAQWARIPMLMKVYGITAVTVLMVITSLGIFGYLSKAHSDQTLVSGDVQARIAIYDERIKTERDNIEADRKQLAQMDAAVDQILGRSDDEKGATKANEIRRGQLKDRSRLQNEILASQKKISAIQDERAPIAAENRKVEAEVGPIKYIAAFVYGANPDANILERAVTWVIILIVGVFDPLAVVMLLASQMTFAWIREEKNRELDEVKPAEVDPERPVPDLSPEPTASDSKTLSIPETVNPDYGNCPKCNTPMLHAGGIGTYCPNKECDVFDGPLLYQENNKEHKHQYHFEEEHSGDEYSEVRIWEPREVREFNQAIQQVDLDIPDSERPEDYETSPRHPRTIEATPHPGKKVRGASILADNAPQALGTAVNSDFGNEFPKNPAKGDVYLRTDYLPNRLFKYNGIKWIEVDKQQSDTYAYNDKYIWHLINQLDQGKYDPEILTEVEKQQIEEYLKKGKDA
jgi:hypothetical protein